MHGNAVCYEATAFLGAKAKKFLSRGDFERT